MERSTSVYKKGSGALDSCFSHSYLFQIGFHLFVLPVIILMSKVMGGILISIHSLDQQLSTCDGCENHM